ncbi:MAG: adenine-specific methyltransferase EcoRI family protein [Peptococcaceae bacterium]|jgi:hypothetical protein|nr:adenine-specific methyltransferase EcoRI family protein [Peptococcaceae bacterium]
MANGNLTQAKNAKNDEFYTQWADIEREAQTYLEYNPDIFRGKTILCPCDDPEWSNFTKFFALHFHEYGLRKLISTSYAVESKNYKEGYQISLFEQNDPKFDLDKTRTRGKIFVLDGDDVNRDGIINIEDLKWDYLEGDGDFRGDEVKKLRSEADIIVTNPPFSLFREFLSWIVKADKQFLIIGNMNAITYKEVFPLIMGNKMWLGPSISSGDRKFNVPNGYPLEAAGCGHDPDGRPFIRVKGVRWFTNLDHGRRHQPLPLMTMADNLKFSKHKEIKGKIGYDRYVNYDAIEVPAIPADYGGIMGVPISFLDKYCPEQFEIIGTSDNGLVNDKYKTTHGLSQKFVDDYYEAGGKGAYKEGNPTAGIYINGVATMSYKRIFIKARGSEK